jgi:hypothetical protein
MNFFERKFTPVVESVLKAQIKMFTSDMRKYGISYANSNLNKFLLDERLSRTILHLYKVVGVYFANDTYRLINEQVQVKGFGFNAQWVKDIVDYFRIHLLDKVTAKITATTKEFIRQMLIQGEKEGLGVDAIARKLESSDLTINRARMIVRTESAKAAFKGRELAKEKSPYQLSSEWIAANDHRTRHSHRLMDGVVIKEGEKFSVPVYKRVGKVDIQIGTDFMIGPGDITAHKENVINCRCTVGERVMFDKNDMPIMKNKTFSI